MRSFRLILLGSLECDKSFFSSAFNVSSLYFSFNKGVLYCQCLCLSCLDLIFTSFLISVFSLDGFLSSLKFAFESSLKYLVI